MLSISSNIAAINTRRMFYSSSTSLDNVFKHLSSGLRINSAADDSAGLQISNRLTSEINGNNTAIRNANDAISVTNVADGAMDESINIMQRMRTLALQARNGINNDNDRIALNDEFQSLSQEMDHIANTTTFAGQKLLNGTFDGQFQVGAYAGQTIGISDMNIQTEHLGETTWSSKNPWGQSPVWAYDVSDLKFASQPLTINGVTFNKDYSSVEDFVSDINTANYPSNNASINATYGPFAVDSNVDLSKLPAYFNINGVTVDLSSGIDLTGWNPSSPSMKNASLMSTVVHRINTALASVGQGITLLGSISFFPSQNFIRLHSLEGNTLRLTDGTPSLPTGSNTSITSLFPQYNDEAYFGSITLKSVSDKYSNIDMQGNLMSSLGFNEADKQKNTVNTLDVLTFDNAGVAISTLDTALQQVGTQQAGLGAKVNALDSITRNLSNGTENLSAARSRIKDADVAKETAELARLQILQQASISVLSQANSRPQFALRLLG